MAYGEVQGKIWRSPTVRGLADHQKLAWNYLLYNQHSNMMGYYLLPLPYMADDLEWSLEKTAETITILEQRGLISYDPEAQVLLVKKYLKYNSLATGNREVGAISRFREIPSSIMAKHLLSAVNEWAPRLLDFRVLLENETHPMTLFGDKEDSSKSQGRVSEDSRQSTVKAKDLVVVKEEEKAGDLEEEKDVFVTRKKRHLSGNKLKWFEEFWDAFDFKRGKAGAGDSWLDIDGLNRELVDKIVDGAKKEVIRRSTLRPDQTPKMAQGWLTDRRWEDDYTAQPTAATNRGNRLGAYTRTEAEKLAFLDRQEAR